MSKRYAPGRHLVSLDLFTDSYRVTGRTLVGTGGIHAELANPNSDYLEMEDAYISRINQPGEIFANYKLCAFRKDNINFIVLQDRREGIPVGTQHARSVYTRGRPAPAFLTVPAFEISGDVYFEGKLSPRDVLAQSIGSYQLIFEAKASASLYSDISYSGDLVLVFKPRIGIFCLESSKG